MEPVPVFSISEVSKRTGLTYDTIRYYTKLGLLSPTKRQDNGQREYEKLDVDRLIFITHLKRTFMPLKEIERYMSLASSGNFENCFRVLSEHKLKVEAQIAEMNEALEAINFKLKYFIEVTGLSGLNEE